MFADAGGFTEDAVSAAGGGVRWHRAGAQEEPDAVFDWRQRSLRANQTATVSWAWQHKRAQTAVEPSSSRPPNVPVLERFADAHDSRQLAQDAAAR